MRTRRTGSSGRHPARPSEALGSRMITGRRWTDTALGMDRPIGRRDFLNGAAVGVGLLGARTAAAHPGEVWPQDQPRYDPPLLTGLRGSHPGSFETAHALRDPDFWTSHPGISDTAERYDLVVVGG